jgi:hypothetical protein
MSCDNLACKVKAHCSCLYPVGGPPCTPKLEESQTTAHNTQRDEIIAKIQLYIDKICDAHNDVRYDISALSVLREVRRIILQ